MDKQSGSINFAAWMAGSGGRIARVVIGAVIVMVGVLVGSTVRINIGFLPVGLGTSNLRIISNAIGAPSKGEHAADLVKS